ncbi:hypothetical protein [Corynebacterium coyleae]|uniref:hypothetical protein n=1 Tax=Corynebacterium coyleae TaxID=53374 RepID=UPI00254AC828|nr:hypothetical protein [Corynebacterium coyleae]MDK8241714.1 hypothetical protein [Corynebacterium coyleae]
METEHNHDTPQQLRTIYATLAEHGVYGQQADKVLQEATPGARFNRVLDVTDEADEQLGLEPCMSFTTLAKQLTTARRNMDETEYNAAVLRRFGTEGAVFALLAPVIHLRLEWVQPRTVGHVETREDGDDWVSVTTTRPE